MSESKLPTDTEIASIIKFIEDLKVPSPSGANVSEFVNPMKKSVNCFMIYRKLVVKEMNLNGMFYEMKKLSKLVSKKWKAEPDAVKEVFKSYAQEVAACSNYSFTTSKPRYNKKWIHYEDSKFKKKPYVRRDKIISGESKTELISEYIEKNSPTNEFASVEPNNLSPSKADSVDLSDETLSVQSIISHNKQAAETLTFRDNVANTTEQFNIQAQSNCASKNILIPSTYDEIIHYSSFENYDYNGNLTTLEFSPSVEESYFSGITLNEFRIYI
ncbi:12234_t:CDS:1 [Ambispora leptoticha]|uniref:12234_t:CDS:1 n=1 Tax=Ambispora leptoticha TaxID=144679 RepID=A0A9N9ILJ9_9GLOM|nr:12234_t:CDS:1 [Ambispora leptoticha]